GSTSALPNAGTSSGDGSDRESTATITGSNGTMSHTRNVPSESEIADTVPTRTRTPGTPGSPAAGRSLPLTSRKIRPETPDRSSDGPGAVANRPVARSQSSEPCTNCEPVTVPPAGAVSVV